MRSGKLTRHICEARGGVKREGLLSALLREGAVAGEPQSGTAMQVEGASCLDTRPPPRHAPAGELFTLEPAATG